MLRIEIPIALFCDTNTSSLSVFSLIMSTPASVSASKWALLSSKLGELVCARRSVLSPSKTGFGI